MEALLNGDCKCSSEIMIRFCKTERVERAKFILVNVYIIVMYIDHGPMGDLTGVKINKYIKTIK